MSGPVTIVDCVKALTAVLMKGDPNSDTAHPPLPVGVVIQLIAEYAIEFVGIVTTAIGDGSPGLLEGIGTKARVAYVYGVCRSNDGGAEAKSILVADTNNQLIRRFYVAENRMAPFCGSKIRGFVSDTFLKSQFQSPFHICIDPNHRGCYVVCDDSSIRYLDSSKQTVTCIAGQAEYGFADGVGEAAKFSCVHGVVCTRNRQIFAADHNNHRVRLIDIPTRTVSTVLGTGSDDEPVVPKVKGAAPVIWQGAKLNISYPRQLIFDRSPNAKPETILYVTTTRAIVRYEVETDEAKCIVLKDNKYISPFGIDCTPTGMLIVSDVYANNIFSVNPLNGSWELLAGTSTYGFADGTPLAAKFGTPISLTVIDADQCVFIGDFSNHRIRCLTLSPKFFS